VSPRNPFEIRTRLQSDDMRKFRIVPQS